MDAAWALSPLSLDACLADQRCVVLSGSLTPVVWPVADLDPATRGAIAAGRVAMELDLRVAWLLAAGRTDEAWSRCAAEQRPLTTQGQLLVRLSAWSAARQSDLGLPASNGPVVVLGADPDGRILAAGRGAVEDVQAVLPGLGWPRWAGPVIICVGDQDPPGLEGGRELVVRPAAPLIRLREIPADANALRGVIASRLASLALGLAAPPAGGWPPWLRVGLPRVVGLVGAGRGASPKDMHQRRQEAGAAAITAMLGEPVIGAIPASLAEAVAAPLLALRRRDRLPKLLDLLRTGTPSPSAITTAYGLDVEQLLSQR
jgi:hypothetical protein